MSRSTPISAGDQLSPTITPPKTDRALKLALRGIGLFMVFGFYPLTVVWPSGWAWQPPNPMYLHMLIGIYAVLGLFLLMAAREPARHVSLIYFTIWSSVVHSAVMAVHALHDRSQISHLWGDVPALLIAAIVLFVLAPRTVTLTPRQ